MADIVPKLVDGDFVRGDLDELHNIPHGSEIAADLIDAMLTEVDESEDAKWQLLRWPGENHVSPFFNCKGIHAFHQRGFNVYRIRFLRPGHLFHARVLYAYDPVRKQIHILAVVIKRDDQNPDPRQYDYHPDHPVSRRVMDEYDRIGIPRLK